jgi:hypothetical protein
VIRLSEFPITAICKLLNYYHRTQALSRTFHEAPLFENMKLSLFVLLPVTASAAVLVPKQVKCNNLGRTSLPRIYSLPDVLVPRVSSLPSLVYPFPCICLKKIAESCGFAAGHNIGPCCGLLLTCKLNKGKYSGTCVEVVPVRSILSSVLPEVTTIPGML